MKEIALIPFVCGAGASMPGCEVGPVDLKRHGLHDFLSGKGLDADWFEDPEALYNTAMGESAHETMPALGSEERKDIIMWHCQHLRDCVARAIRTGRMPVTIGGDHTMAAASIAGFAKAKEAHGRIGVLWVDAHPDINTPETSMTQAMHGMPVAALLGRGDADLCGLGGGPAVLKPEHICYLGIRDIDPDEQSLIDRKPINDFTMRYIDKIGVAAAFDEAMARLKGKVDHLILSLDLDAFDPPEAPAVGTPVPGGFKKAELLAVLAGLVKKHEFGLIELTEFNPLQSGHDKTRQLAFDALAALLPVSEEGRHRLAQG